MNIYSKSKTETIEFSFQDSYSEIEQTRLKEAGYDFVIFIATKIIDEYENVEYVIYSPKLHINGVDGLIDDTLRKIILEELRDEWTI